MDVIRKAPVSEEHKMIFNQIWVHIKVEMSTDITHMHIGSTICSAIWNTPNERGSNNASQIFMTIQRLGLKHGKHY